MEPTVPAPAPVSTSFPAPFPTLAYPSAARHYKPRAYSPLRLPLLLPSPPSRVVKEPRVPSPPLRGSSVKQRKHERRNVWHVGPRHSGIGPRPFGLRRPSLGGQTPAGQGKCPPKIAGLGCGNMGQEQCIPNRFRTPEPPLRMVCYSLQTAKSGPISAIEDHLSETGPQVNRRCIAMQLSQRPFGTHVLSFHCCRTPLAPYLISIRVEVRC